VAAAELDVVASAATVVVWEMITVVTPVAEGAAGSRRPPKRSPVVPALPLGEESLAKISDTERFVDDEETTSCEVSCTGGLVIVEFSNLGRLICLGK
jgi:hypothetical protein